MFYLVDVIMAIIKQRWNDAIMAGDVTSQMDVYEGQDDP